LKYKILPHIADIKLKVTADSLEELFSGALKGMAEILTLKKDLTTKQVKKEIKISSIDFSSLLIDFLSEILTLSDIEDSVFTDINIKKFLDKEIEAEILGFKVRQFKEEIKAATYHRAEIKKNEKGKWEVEILFDI